MLQDEEAYVPNDMIQAGKAGAHRTADPLLPVVWSHNGNTFLEGI